MTFFQIRYIITPQINPLRRIEMDVLKHYVDLFNKEDEELYINDIDNSHERTLDK